ncbi:MAG: replicative DNA helicase, partial [Prevotella sp.]|nr:replicative DNA helicase [Prevotella sp.]
YHAHILAQKSLMRQLISYTSRVQELAFDDTADPDAVMQEAEGSLFEIAQKNMKSDYTQIDPVLGEAVKILQKAAQNTSGLTGVPTGYDKLDDMTAGWQPSDMVIIAGRPGMGKTAFALSLAKNIAVDYQQPIGFFSLEMSNVQLVNRLISNVCEISGKKIQNGQLSKDEWERLDRNLRKLTGAPIYVDDTPGLSIFELRSKARRLVREKDVKIIMVDYLQLMNASGMRFGNRQEEVSTISRSLKSLAKELNVPILVLSQVNRELEKREGTEGKRPQLSDLRESGAIEQDADMVIFVHRSDYYRIDKDEKGRDLRGKAEIIIAKHRKGSTGTVTLRFDADYTRFSNVEDYYATPVTEGGEVIGSRLNGDDEPFGPPPPDDGGF